MTVDPTWNAEDVLAHVALVGLPDISAQRLRNALERNRFHVMTLSPDDLASEETVSDFDVVIWTRALPYFMTEDAFWKFLLSVRGFLICEDDTGEETPVPYNPITIHPSMSDEEIFSRVNSRIFEAGVRSRRRCPRISVGLPVTYSFGSGMCQSTIRTLGRNGAYVVSLTPPERGTVITLNLQLPDELEPVSLEARVVYTVGYSLEDETIAQETAPEIALPTYPGFGVQFERISQEAQVRVVCFIDKHLT